SGSPTRNWTCSLQPFSLDEPGAIAAHQLVTPLIDISAPAGSTVLINVTGSSVRFQNGSVMEMGITSASVLYNFVTATSVDLAVRRMLTNRRLGHAPTPSRLFARSAAACGVRHCERTGRVYGPPHERSRGTRSGVPAGCTARRGRAAR